MGNHDSEVSSIGSDDDSSDEDRPEEQDVLNFGIGRPDVPNSMEGSGNRILVFV